MDDSDKILPICRMCGRPIRDGSEIVERETEDPDEPAFLCHRTCHEEARRG